MQDTMEDDRNSEGDGVRTGTLPSARPSYTHVPNNLIGKLLDRGKITAYALHLLAIKCGRGDGFALNLTAVNKPANTQSVRRRRSKRYRDKPVPEKPGYGVGERGFQKALALMTKQATLGHADITTTGGYLHANPDSSSGLKLDRGVFLQ